MAEELKPHHYWREDRITGRLVVITPDEYEQWGKDNQPSEAYRPAFTRAQLPSQGGGCRPLGYMNKKDIARLQDEITWDGSYLTVGIDHWAQWQEDTPYDHLQAIYTHPAYQVADGVVVPRELLKTVLDPVCTDDWAPACKQLRALLNGGRS